MGVPVVGVKERAAEGHLGVVVGVDGFHRDSAGVGSRLLPLGRDQAMTMCQEAAIWSKVASGHGQMCGFSLRTSVT